MNDTIYRQAALDFVSAMNFCGEISDEAYQKLTVHFENLPSAQPKWIPCSERLPEENGQYLITIKYKHVNDSYEDVYAEHGEWLDGEWDMFCFGHCGEVEDIIAWMPLPEPARLEAQDE